MFQFYFCNTILKSSSFIFAITFFKASQLFCFFVFWVLGRFFNWSEVDLRCCVNFCYIQKSDSVIYILFHILFHYGLSQDIEHSSLCYTIGPCCFSIHSFFWKSRRWWEKKNKFLDIYTTKCLNFIGSHIYLIISKRRWL